ncbi:MAG TPA: hypothetical protein VK034_04620 [Enhygromyxa sp.]|nr:hypothetical protein [Enhygromyxa sp.]
MLWLSLALVTVGACKDDDGGDDDNADETGDGDGDPTGDGDDDPFGDGDGDPFGDGDGEGDDEWGDGDADPTGDGDDEWGDGDGDEDPDPTGGMDCCSLFDCPGTEVECDCGIISGCFITDGECGHCITQADCEAYCENAAPIAPFTLMVPE